MKKFIQLFLALIAIAFQSVAQETSENSNSTTVGLHFKQKTTTDPTVHRAPARLSVDVDVYYNTENNTIEIEYDGEEEGEVFIFMDDNLVGYDSHINTCIQLPLISGQYIIEIIGETWIGQGEVVVNI